MQEVTPLKKLIKKDAPLPPAPKPRIDSMSRDGQVEMKFSEPMKVPGAVADGRRNLQGGI